MGLGVTAHPAAHTHTQHVLYLYVLHTHGTYCTVRLTYFTLQLVHDFEERVKSIGELRKKADDSRKQNEGKRDVQELVEAMIAHSNERVA